MSVTTTDLWRMSATDLATVIRSGQASSREVLEAHLRRIEAVDPSVNAVTAVLGEQALAAAKAADQATAGGGELRPLHGVPFTVKENIDLAGTPTTQGIKAFAGAIPGRDAPHVARLRAAGAIPLGHTNCPDRGIRWHAGSDLWGATINPWDRSRTPGGSSGGEAAALATGMTPLGVGGDLGGSLRWPAQCCGICAEILHGMRMAVAVNALGLPAVTLPVGTGGGLPHSVQVIGPRYREDLCLDAAGALEDRAGIITPIDPR